MQLHTCIDFQPQNESKPQCAPHSCDLHALTRTSSRSHSPARSQLEWRARTTTTCPAQTSFWRCSELARRRSTTASDTARPWLDSDTYPVACTPHTTTSPPAALCRRREANTSHQHPRRLPDLAKDRVRRAPRGSGGKSAHRRVQPSGSALQPPAKSEAHTVYLIRQVRLDGEALL